MWLQEWQCLSRRSTRSFRLAWPNRPPAGRVRAAPAVVIDGLEDARLAGESSAVKFIALSIAKVVPEQPPKHIVEIFQCLEMSRQPVNHGHWCYRYARGA